MKPDLLVAGAVLAVDVLLLLLQWQLAMTRTARFCSRARARVFLRYRFFTMQARMASSSAAARTAVSAASAAAISAVIRASAALILSFP